MPLFEFICKDCGRLEREHYFRSFAGSELPFLCLECGGVMTKLAGVPVVRRFRPFVTRNIKRDGSPVYVRDRAQLRDLMRENHLVHSPMNDTVEGHADPREFLASAKEERREFPNKYRKMKENVKTLTAAEAEKLSQRAQATHFETRRA